MVNNQKVSAVIVTYNRLNLLKSAIESVLKQKSKTLKHLIIINGASTDGTGEYLDSIDDKRIIIEHLPKNIGGAGGFNRGIRLFFEQTQDDFVWVMDDDALPEENALSELMEMFKNNVQAGWGASKVIWTDGNWSKMNVPAALQDGSSGILNNNTEWVKLRNATFVSTIFKREVVQAIGLPQKEYFVWGDDIEYTDRAARVAEGIFVRSSIVVHASQTNASPGAIFNENNQNRLPRYLYEYRNRILTSRRRKSAVRLTKTLAHTGIDFVKTLFWPKVKYRNEKLKIIIKGTMNGAKFNPKIEYLRK
ncbi:glycosyltransferase family 2 protein [Leuconostoc palmae]|uniref:glycosyltransferase family 2 protein n=1 Tax=Leuconostoc palmae TaxID=501487 RepID=UPI001C7DDB8F|nr:glycosyltransferase family 2 protein [Leuconostoc palmae]